MAFDNHCRILKDNLQIAIQLLSAHREDHSDLHLQNDMSRDISEIYGVILY